MPNCMCSSSSVECASLLMVNRAPNFSARLATAVAAVMALRGRRQLQEFHAVPEETVETLKEDVEWLKSRKS